MEDVTRAQTAVVDSESPQPRRTGLDALMIELATPAHVPYLRRLKETVMSNRYRPAHEAAEFERWREVYCTEEYFNELLDDPTAMLLCIGSLREPVGMVVLRMMDGYLEVDDLLCLYPDSGDPTRLLVACLRYAQAWRVQRVVLDIYPGHTSVEEFLERHGFEHAGLASNDLGHPMHRYERFVPSEGALQIDR